MTQGPLILQQPPHLAPRGAAELFACLLQLPLSLTTAQEMARRVKPPQSRLRLLHGLFRLHRLIETPLRLAPGPTRTARHPSGITTATRLLCHLGIGLTRHLQLALGLVPLTLQHALKLALGMQHVQAHRDRRAWLRVSFLRLGLTPLIDSLHPLLETRAAIGNDVLKVGPLRHHLTPTRSRAVRPSLPRSPSQTHRLDGHQNRFTMKKDCIQAPCQHPTL